jgi:putative ABC transport system permease protein
LLPFERGAALVTEGFAEANRHQPGDELAAVVKGRRQRVRVAGVALSPEYVYAIGPGMLFPDDRSFGIVWMPGADLGPAAGLDEAFNSALLRHAPRAVEGEVLAEADRILAPWGGTGAYPRADLVSNRFLSEEILQLRATALVVPGIFLGIAAFLLSVIASRLVAAQRQQIGMLKALGYADAAIAAHYAKLVGAIVLAGVAAGSAAGIALGRVLAGVYASFYRFPFLLHGDAPWVVAIGAGLSLAAALLGVAGAVRRAARLPPADAMRPERPVAFRPRRTLARASRLSPVQKVILRNLYRRPVRSLLSAVGIAAGVAVLVLAGSMSDALAHLLRLQFDSARREDAVVVFSEAAGQDAAVELRSLAGVRAVERFRSVPATLRSGARSRRLELAGLEPGGELWRLVDVRGRVVPVPPAGLVLSAHLGRTLDVRPGDTVLAQVHEGRRPLLELPVASFVEDFVGTSATIRLEALDAALGEGALSSGALLRADGDALPRITSALSARPRVASVTTAAELRRSMEDVVDRFMGGMIAVIGGFALVLAGGVVYNAARVAFAERQRDLATLRVIGFSEAEAWRILAGEIAALVALAIPLGCGLGLGLVSLTARALSSDLFRLPPVVGPATWGTAVGVVAAVGALLAGVAWSWVRKVDLVEVLKARE